MFQYGTTLCSAILIFKSLYWKDFLPPVVKLGLTTHLPELTKIFNSSIGVRNVGCRTDSGVSCRQAMACAGESRDSKEDVSPKRSYLRGGTRKGALVIFVRITVRRVRPCTESPHRRAPWRQGGPAGRPDSSLHGDLHDGVPRDKESAAAPGEEIAL